MKADPAEAAMIEEKYSKLRAEIIDQYREKSTEKQEETKIEPITSSTSMDEILKRAPNLHAALMQAYENYFNNLPSAITQGATEEQKENFLADFMRTSLVAKELIYQYNQDSKIKAATEETGEVEDFTFILNGKRINTADFKTIPELRNLIFNIDTIIDNLNKVSKPSLENINSVAEIKAIKNKLELLIKTRSKSGYSEEMKRAIEQIEQLQEMQNNIVFDGAYYINGKIMERVTRAIQKVLPDKYKYNQMAKVLKAFDTAKEQFPNLTEPNEAFIDTFFKELRTKKIKDDGLSEVAFTKMKQDMLNFINRGYISREGELSPIQNGTVTVNSPVDNEGMVQKWTFELENGVVKTGRHTVNFGEEIVQDNKVSDPGVTYDQLRQNKKVDYTFNAVSTEGVFDKFNTLKQELEPIVADRAYDEATEAGNYIDKAIKELFAGKQPVFDPAKITEEAFNQLFGDNGYLAKIKEMVDTGQYYVVSEGLRVYDEEVGIAGEIDLLLVDQTGKMFIVDVKTGKENKWAGYNDPTSVHNKKKIENTYQQAAYARLLQNMFPGLEVNVGILPIQITYNDETALITSVTRPVDKKQLKQGEKRLLAPGRYIVSLDKDSVKEDIDKIIPAKQPITVGTEMSPAAKAKLNKLGFTDDMIKLMSDEDIETAKAATSKDDVKNLVAKYELLTQEKQPQDDVPTPTGEEQVVSTLSFGTETEIPGEEGVVTSTLTFDAVPTLISVDDVVKALKGINDMDSFKSYKQTLNAAFLKQEINPTDVETMDELLKAKEQELSDPTNIKVSESALKVGDKLIVINTIFKAKNKNEVFAVRGDELRITSIQGDKVKFKFNGSQRTLDLSEINDYFTTMSIEEYKAKYGTVADPVTIETSNSSSEVTDNFLESANLNELDNEGKSISLEDALSKMEEDREENCQ
jgi:ribosomal protein S8